MKVTQLLLAALAARLGSCAECAEGSIDCGTSLLAKGFTEEYLTEVLNAGDPDGSVPGIDVAFFTCLADNKLEKEGSYCLCECIGGDGDPNKLCTECPAPPL